MTDNVAEFLEHILVECVDIQARRQQIVHVRNIIIEVGFTYPRRQHRGTSEKVFVEYGHSNTRCKQTVDVFNVAFRITVVRQQLCANA